MFIEVNNLSVLSSMHQQQMVISCLILGKYLILKYTTINATIAAYGRKLQLNTPDFYNKEHVTVNTCINCYHSKTVDNKPIF